MIFAKQANISNGHQQINNGAIPEQDAQARARTGDANGWTLERRRKQAELMSALRPWEQSTGPKTPEGKATSSRNAWKGGHRAQLRELSKMINEYARQSRCLANG